jgi:predicted PurR-regulated permease PerM
MHVWGIPRAIAAAVAIALVAGAFGGAFYRVSNDAGAVLEQVPPAVQRLRLALTLAQQEHTGALEHVQRTAEELEKLAKAAASNAAPSRLMPPPPAEASIDFRSLLLVGTGNVVIALGQLLSALFLTFFLLSAGDLFRRKIVHAAGPSLARQKTVLRILNDVDRLNQRYFAVVMLINIAVGVVTGFALYAIGMEQPLVWGIAAAILHIIPYIGAAAVASAAALVAYGQFGTIQWALLAGAMPLLAAGALGVGLQTWLMGRAARMNAPVVFVSLLFWGMLWGGWGLLLAVPVMVAIRTICDHVERLKRFGEILGP